MLVRVKNVFCAVYEILSGLIKESILPICIMFMVLQI